MHSILTWPEILYGSMVTNGNEKGRKDEEIVIPREKNTKRWLEKSLSSTASGSSLPFP